MMPFQAMRLRNPVVVTPNNYSTLVLASTPSQYWRLGEASGTTAADASGNGRAGTYTRDASNTTIGGNGLLNGGGNGAFQGPSAPSSPVSGIGYSSVAADPASDFTVTLIIQPGLPPTSGFGCLLQLGSYGFGVPELGILDQGGGMFKIRVARSAVSSLFNSTSSWAYGTKLHVKLSRSGTDTIALRVNGAAEGSANFNFASATTFTSLGRYDDNATPSFQFAGGIDEFAVWNSFISDTTTDAQYAAI